MSRLGMVMTCVVVFLVGVAVPQVARAQEGQAPEAVKEAQVEEQGGNRRESEITVPAPDGNGVLISFIDSPTVTCYQPDPSEDVCYFNWHHIFVDAAPAGYIINLTITLTGEGRIVGHYRGFFQPSMLIPHTMHGRGFKVPCGPLGASGNPDLGNSYGYRIEAEDSDGATSANIGSIGCPAYIP